MVKRVVSNKQIAKAFRNAVPRLSVTYDDRNQKHEYICWAIAGKWAPGRERGAGTRQLAAIDIIELRLGQSHSLEGWLRTKGITGTYEQIQAHRHAWLQLLIKEFEAK